MSAGHRTAPSPIRLWMRKLGTEAARQTSMLYAAQLAASALNFLLLTALARALTVDEYGVYSFCLVSVINLLGYLFEFGVFAAGARVLATAADAPAERRALGALFVAALGIGALFAATVAAAGPVVDRLYGLDVSGLLLAAAPLAAAVPLQQAVEQACQGTNRIGTLALLRLALPVSGLAIVGVLVALHDVTPLTALVASLGGVLGSTLLAVSIIRPSFEHLGEELARLARATREFGLHMYSGRVVAMLSSRLDAILIPFFIGTTFFGVYNIAQRVCDPVVSLARSLAMTRFKAFANRTEVSFYIVRWNATLLAGAVFALVIFAPLAIHLFLKKFEAAIPLIVPFAFVALFAGLLQPYNVFLSAHGRGRELRNIALFLGVVNVVGLLSVVKPFGLAGAAWWASCSTAFSFLLSLYYYRRVRNELRGTAGDWDRDADDDGGRV